MWSEFLKRFGDEEYLRDWIATAYKTPEKRQDMLCFYGPRGCGKSMFHYALKELPHSNVVRMDGMLSNKYFNGELAYTRFAVIEEKAPDWSPMEIYDYIEDDTIKLTRLGQPNYWIPNKTHWIQYLDSPPLHRLSFVEYIEVPPLEVCYDIKTVLAHLRSESQQFFEDLFVL